LSSARDLLYVTPIPKLNPKLYHQSAAIEELLRWNEQYGETESKGGPSKQLSYFT